MILFATTLTAGLLALSGGQSALAADIQEVTRLERLWDKAHVQADVQALDLLCAPSLVLTVPGMAPMSKTAMLGFWRSTQARITRYDTSDTRVQVVGDVAVVTGQLIRARDLNGSAAEDRWRFTKTYARIQGRWMVVAFHASDAA